MGTKGREWLLKWLPARAHDNGLYLIFSNGVGRDDNEVRTGNAMVLDPYGDVLAETWKAADDSGGCRSSGRDTRNRAPACDGFAAVGRSWRRPSSTPTGREQDIRTVRFSTTDPGSSNRD